MCETELLQAFFSLFGLCQGFVVAHGILLPYARSFHLQRTELWRVGLVAPQHAYLVLRPGVKPALPASQDGFLPPDYQGSPLQASFVELNDPGLLESELIPLVT